MHSFAVRLVLIASSFCDCKGQIVAFVPLRLRESDSVCTAQYRLAGYESLVYLHAICGGWAGRLCSGLQIRLERFDSATRLQMLPSIGVSLELWAKFLKPRFAWKQSPGIYGRVIMTGHLGRAVRSTSGTHGMSERARIDALAPNLRPSLRGCADKTHPRDVD